MGNAPGQTLTHRQGQVLAMAWLLNGMGQQDLALQRHRVIKAQEVRR